MDKQLRMFLTDDDIAALEAENEALRYERIQLLDHIDEMELYIEEMTKAFTEEFGISPEELFHDV